MISTIAVIGLGQMGASYTRYASSLAEQVICFDHNEYQRASFLHRLLEDDNPFDIFEGDKINTQNIQVVNDIQLIWQSNPVLTIIATHKDSHCYYACLAMISGSHVLTEKPLCVSLDEAEAMKKTALETKKKLFVGFSLHATPCFVKLKEIIANQEKIPDYYQVYRIGAVPEDYTDNVSARFDLLSHDTDFCLQLFKFPQHTIVQEVSNRSCNKIWLYEGFRVEMIGKMPVTHPNGFEYGYKLTFLDHSSVEFSSNNLQKLILKNDKQEVVHTIPLKTISTCKTILEKTLYSVFHNSYEEYLSHELSIINGVNCMNMLIHDHKAGLSD
ncbi:Gfo/Idh/MocA family protein [Legionella sp. km772]|uniref:Gfo/Idh/MocA family protein n=1 Tax=Legionella sp. km772 TaxID=2498111 RepID=UPI000F8C7163|nr:Gfo/Idh/MocA family oxidoreductase [Legionella sp. km772]RUR05834.1 Gfo/Idh/MocA family oxidoreductase [Legionella sp. km772]